MAIYLTQEEYNDIQSLSASALAGDIPWGDVYQRVSDVILSKVNIVDALFDTEVDEYYSVAMWFAGAALVNRGEGSFSTLIREYSARQAELHFTPNNTLYSANGQLMQEARIRI